YVYKVIRSGTAYQILKVLDTRSETVRIVKVISRSMINDEKISSDIKFLLKIKHAEGSESRSRLLADFQTTFDWFMVFEEPRVTLRDLLNNKDIMPLPSRHIREITFQIIMSIALSPTGTLIQLSRAKALHRHSLLHLDISPSTIEVAYPSTNTEYEYAGNGTFRQKVTPISYLMITRVLKCSRVYLTFHGDAAITPDRNIGTDQYRAPEVVFVIHTASRYQNTYQISLGWASKCRSDNFSIGCVMWELLKGRPLFLPCEQEGNYVKAKTHAFKAVLGYFPRQMRERASIMHEGIFIKYSGELHEPWDLSDELKRFINEVEPLELTIKNMDTYHVMDALTRLSPKDRLPLCDVLSMPFFTSELI
ncbi:LOW QUALITY PROTEIN: hypothetical protein CVT26_013210, partial [Gymnopilus dilepis]